MTEQLKAAGYIRVSSKEQVDGESLSTQRQSIKNYCKAQGWKLTEIYADEGISGGSITERIALLKCLHDGQNGKFNILVIHRLSRFGRNARELLENHHQLEQVGVSLRSVSEGIDFGNKYGKAMLGMFSVMAELERDIIRETMLENRIARGKKGIPTSGELPFGRTFDRQTGKWELNEEKAKLIQWAANEYLKGVSLHDVSETLRIRHHQPMSYSNLITILSKRCGDTWTITFRGEKPITYQIPRILDDETIQKIKERLEYNGTVCRTDVKKYVLTGFIRCEACGHNLFGQTQLSKYNTTFQYYKHPHGRHEKCQAFTGIRMNPIEKAVFQTIFENIVDVPSFEKAIAENLPDEKMQRQLADKIEAREKELKQISKQIDALVDLAMSGTLEKATIRSKEQSLIQAKSKASEELEANRQALKSMPDINHIKKEAEQIRRQLMERFSGPDRIEEMTFDEKKTLLHWLFDGKDKDGKPYGIYISRRGTRFKEIVDYFLYGKITGLRTLKGDDINHLPDDDGEGGKDNLNYKSNIVTFIRPFLTIIGMRLYHASRSCRIWISRNTANLRMEKSNSKDSAERISRYAWRRFQPRAEWKMSFCVFLERMNRFAWT